MTTEVLSDAEIQRRKGGRPKLPEHLKRTSPRVSFRLPVSEIEAWIDGPRKRSGLNRTQQISRMLDYADAHMPKDYGL